MPDVRKQILNLEALVRNATIVLYGGKQNLVLDTRLQKLIADALHAYADLLETSDP